MVRRHFGVFNTHANNAAVAVRRTQTAKTQDARAVNSRVAKVAVSRSAKCMHAEYGAHDDSWLVRTVRIGLCVCVSALALRSMER